MRRRDEGIIRYVGREICKEAAKQLRGFPREFKDQLVGDGSDHRTWGGEFARQIFGTPRRRSRPR